jgi:hypothetical protein
VGQRLWGNRRATVTVRFELGAAATGLVRLDADFYPASATGGAPAAEMSLEYAPGAAPAEDVAKVDVRRGSYDLAVRLDYGAARPPQITHQSVEVDDDEEVFVHLGQ